MGSPGPQNHDSTRLASERWSKAQISGAHSAATRGCELSAELPRADAFGHFSGSRGQQAGVGTSCHFARLVREAEFSLELGALLLVPEKQPEALHKLPGTSACHMSTPGLQNIFPEGTPGLPTAVPASESTAPSTRPLTLARPDLLSSSDCLLQASPPSVLLANSRTPFFQALNIHSRVQQCFPSTYYVPAL